MRWVSSHWAGHTWWGVKRTNAQLCSLRRPRHGLRPGAVGTGDGVKGEVGDDIGKVGKGPAEGYGSCPIGHADNIPPKCHLSGPRASDQDLSQHPQGCQGVTTSTWPLPGEWEPLRRAQEATPSRSGWAWGREQAPSRVERVLGEPAYNHGAAERRPPPLPSAPTCRGSCCGLIELS